MDISCPTYSDSAIGVFQKSKSRDTRYLVYVFSRLAKGGTTRYKPLKRHGVVLKLTCLCMR